MFGGPRSTLQLWGRREYLRVEKGRKGVLKFRNRVGGELLRQRPRQTDGQTDRDRDRPSVLKFRNRVGGELLRHRQTDASLGALRPWFSLGLVRTLGGCRIPCVFWDRFGAVRHSR